VGRGWLSKAFNLLLAMGKNKSKCRVLGRSGHAIAGYCRVGAVRPISRVSRLAMMFLGLLIFKRQLTQELISNEVS
jgi:hypothetical protein